MTFEAHTGHGVRLDTGEAGCDPAGARTGEIPDCPKQRILCCRSAGSQGAVPNRNRMSPKSPEQVTRAPPLPPPPTRGLHFLAMGTLICAELHKDVRLPQRVLSWTLGLTLGHSCASGTDYDSQAFTVSFGLWFRSATIHAQKVMVTGNS